jgi:hypothetical protein
MKNLMYLIAVCFTVAMIGCESTQTVSPGAVSPCGAKEGEPCAKAKSDCCNAAKCNREAAEASPGAVGEKAPCSEMKTDCQKAGCTKSDANLGAVGETAPCGATKTGCTKSDANLGAVSEKAPCGAAKSGCGR